MNFYEMSGVAAIVLFTVELGKLTGMIKSGNIARVTNVVLALLFSGFDIATPEGAMMSTAVVVIASGAHEIIEILVKKYTEYKEVSNG